MEFIREKYPDLPGVYLMKDNEGKVIYVGKANSLRARLAQCFSKENSMNMFILAFERMYFVGA